MRIKVVIKISDNRKQSEIKVFNCFKEDETLYLENLKR